MLFDVLDQWHSSPGSISDSLICTMVIGRTVTGTGIIGCSSLSFLSPQPTAPPLPPPPPSAQHSSSLVFLHSLFSTDLSLLLSPVYVFHIFTLTRTLMPSPPHSPLFSHPLPSPHLSPFSVPLPCMKYLMAATSPSSLQSVYHPLIQMKDKTKKEFHLESAYVQPAKTQCICVPAWVHSTATHFTQ